RIVRDAKRQDTERRTNAIVGIQTTILPVTGLQEMLMIGTASHHPGLVLPETHPIATSDLTCQEMWNLARMGYGPLKLLLGTSVYSLGFVGGITSFFKSFVRGEIPELSKLVYEARENSLDLIQREAQHLGADKVVGVKTYVHQLGGGLIEFLAIGTAVKKMEGLQTASTELPPQTFQVDKDTFVNTSPYAFGVDLNQGT
ncbi:MAG: heavy metal-binding domain-containing protein, partial [Candidatus Sericytochromatia bacterium]